MLQCQEHINRAEKYVAILEEYDLYYNELSDYEFIKLDKEHRDEIIDGLKKVKAFVQSVQCTRKMIEDPDLGRFILEPRYQLCSKFLATIHDNRSDFSSNAKSMKEAFQELSELAQSKGLTVTESTIDDHSHYLESDQAVPPEKQMFLRIEDQTGKIYN